MEKSDQENSESLTLYSCGSCGETNEILIDVSIGRNYEVIEDCYVCCKPNIIHILKEDGRWSCWAASENE